MRWTVDDRAGGHRDHGVCPVHLVGGMSLSDHQWAMTDHDEKKARDTVLDWLAKHDAGADLPLVTAPLFSEHLILIPMIAAALAEERRRVFVRWDKAMALRIVRNLDTSVNSAREILYKACWEDEK